MWWCCLCASGLNGVWLHRCVVRSGECRVLERGCWPCGGRLSGVRWARRGSWSGLHAYSLVAVGRGQFCGMDVVEDRCETRCVLLGPGFVSLCPAVVGSHGLCTTSTRTAGPGMWAAGVCWVSHQFQHSWGVGHATGQMSQKIVLYHDLDCFHLPACQMLRPLHLSHQCFQHFALEQHFNNMA